MSEHTGPSDESLEAMLEQQAEQERVAEELGLVVNRLTVFLEEQGVLMAAPERGPDVSKTTEDVELAAEAGANRSRAVQVAGAIAIVNAMLEEAGEADPEIKKQLQAGLVAQGLGGPWLRAVDQELPGDPLDMERDFQLVADKIETTASNRMINREGTRLNQERFYGLLGEDGQDADNVLAVLELANLYAMRQLRPSAGDNNAWPEEVRVVLARRGIEVTPAWQRIIDYER